MLSRLNRYALVSQRAFGFRLHSTTTAAKPESTLSDDGVDIVTRETEFQQESSAISEVKLNIRDNRPKATRDTIWMSWYSWNQVTMVHILRLVRYAEKHFGPVKDFTVIRDGDVSSRYINWMYLTFKSPESARQFSSETKFRVPVHSIPTADELVAGPGLQDIVHLLIPYNGPITEPPADSSTVAEDLALDDPSRGFLEVTVRRSTRDELPISVGEYNKHRESSRRYILSSDVYHQLAKAFLAFKGFHPNSSISGSNLAMDRCIEKFANHLDFEKSYKWNTGENKARVSIDRNPSLTTGKDVSGRDENESRSGPLVQLRRL